MLSSPKLADYTLSSPSWWRGKKKGKQLEEYSVFLLTVEPTWGRNLKAVQLFHRPAFHQFCSNKIQAYSIQLWKTQLNKKMTTKLILFLIWHKLVHFVDLFWILHAILIIQSWVFERQNYGKWRLEGMTWFISTCFSKQK